MTDIVDHYAVLGMCPTATGSEIYSAYCHAVRQWLKDDPTFNHNNLMLIQNSYRILQNPGKRRAFHAEWLLKRSKHDQMNKAESSVHKLPHMDAIFSENLSKTTEEETKPPKLVTSQQDHLPQFEEEQKVETIFYESINEEAHLQCNGNLNQGTYSQYLENLQEETIPQLNDHIDEEASIQGYEKLNGEPQYYETIHEDHQSYENLHEEISPQYSEGMQVEMVQQFNGHSQESQMGYYGYQQDPSLYFKYQQETASQYYGYLQGIQYQSYQYINHGSQPGCYEFLYENQDQFHEYLQENQTHYVY